MDMSDSEFLTYCDSMADTPRCGFVPVHIARLAKLAGMSDDIVSSWENTPNGVFDMDRHAIREAVQAALKRQNGAPNER